jgi:hypothetical protein
MIDACYSAGGYPIPPPKGVAGEIADGKSDKNLLWFNTFHVDTNPDFLGGCFVGWNGSMLLNAKEVSDASGTQIEESDWFKWRNQFWEDLSLGNSVQAAAHNADALVNEGNEYYTDWRNRQQVICEPYEKSRKVLWDAPEQTYLP